MESLWGSYISLSSLRTRTRKVHQYFLTRPSIPLKALEVVLSKATSDGILSLLSTEKLSVLGAVLQTLQLNCPKGFIIV